MPKILSPEHPTEPTETPDMDTMPRANVLTVWSDARTKVDALLNTAQTLTVTDVCEVDKMKLARTIRLDLRSIRIEVENKRKELGEEALRRKQTIDSQAKTLRELIEPLEARLLQQEQFVEIENQRIEDEAQQRRSAEISPYLTGPLAVNLGTMEEGEYHALLQDMKDGHAFRLQREKREKEEADAKAKKDADDLTVLESENARLKLEVDKRAAEQAKADKKLAKERKDAADALKAEQDRAAAAEKQAQEQRDAITAQEAARKQQEANAEDARVAQEEAKAAAPDKDKINTFAWAVRQLVIPEATTPKGITAMKEITEKRESFAKWIEKHTETL